MIATESTPDTGRHGVAARIEACLSRIRPRALSETFRRDAAVLMPVFEKGGEPHFLLTLRTEAVETHKGQISFPGGVCNPGETFLQTALRETFEEVGIDPAGIRLLGRFHEYLSINDHRVMPFAGYLAYPFETKANAAEVAAILHVPFSAFCDPARLRIGRREIRGREAEVLYYTFERHVIWGLTARVIRDFLAALGENPA